MIPVEELREYLGSDVVDTDLPLIEAMESAAVSVVSRAGRDWYGDPTEFVDILDGSGSPNVWALRTPREDYPLAVAVRFLFGSWETVDPNSVMVIGRRVTRIDGIRFPSAVACARLTYTAGAKSDDTFVSGGLVSYHEVRNAVRDVVRFLFREGRSWTLKDLAAPAAVAVGGAAGVELVPSVLAIKRATYRAIV